MTQYVPDGDVLEEIGNVAPMNVFQNGMFAMLIVGHGNLDASIDLTRLLNYVLQGSALRGFGNVDPRSVYLILMFVMGPTNVKMVQKRKKIYAQHGTAAKVTGNVALTDVL